VNTVINLRLHTRREISRLAARKLAFQDGVCSMEFFGTSEEVEYFFRRDKLTAEG
jgi:hypothetical protein